MIQLERWHTSLWLQPFQRIIQLSFQETQTAFELRPKIEGCTVLALSIEIPTPSWTVSHYFTQSNVM